MAGLIPLTASNKDTSKSTFQYISEYFSVMALENVSHFRLPRDITYSAINKTSNFISKHIGNVYFILKF